MNDLILLAEERADLEVVHRVRPVNLELDGAPRILCYVLEDAFGRLRQCTHVQREVARALACWFHHVWQFGFLDAVVLRRCVARIHFQELLRALIDFFELLIEKVIIKDAKLHVSEAFRLFLDCCGARATRRKTAIIHKWIFFIFHLLFVHCCLLVLVLHLVGARGVQQRRTERLEWVALRPTERFGVHLSVLLDANCLRLLPLKILNRKVKLLLGHAVLPLENTVGPRLSHSNEFFPPLHLQPLELLDDLVFLFELDLRTENDAVAFQNLGLQRLR